jgi:hypothetical protein
MGLPWLTPQGVCRLPSPFRAIGRSSGRIVQAVPLMSLLRRCHDVRLCYSSGRRTAVVKQKMRWNLLMVRYIMSAMWVLTELLLMHDHLRGCGLAQFQHVLWGQLQRQRAAGKLRGRRVRVKQIHPLK